MKKVSGSVSLSIVIDSDGIPRRIRLLKGIGYGLDEEAVAAVQKWRFAPGMKEGHPVPTPARVEVTFRLL
jgi:TonB family protein